MNMVQWFCAGTYLIATTATLIGSPYPSGNVITSGVAVTGDHCLPPNAVQVMYDERSVTAIDSALGSAVYRLEGESLRKVAACGNVALFLTDRHAGFYSARLGRWLLRSASESDNAVAISKFYNFSLGQNIVAIATTNEAIFFHASKGSFQSVSLNADRLRAIATFNDAACTVTDRRVFCTSAKSASIKEYSLHDMHIRTLVAESGKIFMRAPEKTLIFYPESERFEYLPSR